VGAGPAGRPQRAKVTQARRATYIPGMAETVYVTRSQVTKAGVSFGSALAIAISWSVNQSILWAILHGILSWIYVIYYALTR
jgi:hypothetical protein